MAARKSAHLKETLQYCADISKGTIPSGMYTAKAVKRFLGDLKKQGAPGFPYSFEPENAEEVIDFAENLTIPDLETADKKLRLLPWMKFIYYNLFGWVHKTEPCRRRFRGGYVEVARKNSKTTSLLFPIILYDFLSTEAAESYFVSKDEKQAGKAYRELLFIIKADPELHSIIEHTVTAITYKNSRIAFFSSESTALDSYKNSCSVIDEFHDYDNDRAVTSFKFGGRARMNSLVLIITSAGLNVTGPCYAENEKARKILNGIMTDETYFTVIYAYDEGDDWQDPQHFIKANPSLGPILRQDILEIDLNDARITPSHQADFKAKTCGIWTNAAVSWIPLQLWEQGQQGPEVDFTTFAEQDAYGSIDLSVIDDFTAYTLCFFRDNYFYLKHRFYIPEQTVHERYLTENINIIEWIQRGIITAIPGPTIDYEYLYQDLVADAQVYHIRELPYDRWQSDRLIEKIQEALPHTVVIPFNQSLQRMAQPTRNFEKLIKEKRLIDHNPVMKWMISNAVIKPDVNNNYKPVKEYRSSPKRIDGVITSIMGVDRCMANLPTDTGSGADFNEVLMLFR
ncbi:MAG: terminase large subunit [Treponema sp.]|jgi:phage terminase large subunit-like protein|nr:terminase large subunit [Treponema sp.]